MGATIAATVAATMAVGVTIAVARAERERRAARRRLARERHFGLLPGERPVSGLQRIALGQLDLAIALLAGDTELPPERAVHETRKALKRLRALLRLLADELGPQAYARESAALRDIGRRLAGARDAEVMVATLDSLLERRPGKLARSRSVARLRAQLVAERDRAAQELDQPATRAGALEQLRAVRARVAMWDLSPARDLSPVQAALQRIYRQGRRRARRAARGKGDRARAMHQWRKRVKDLRYVAEMLESAEPGAKGGGKGGAGRGRSARRRSRMRAQQRLRRIARRADRLGEALGEDHDLVMLDALLRGQAPGGGATGANLAAAMRPRARRRLRKLIARRRRRLRKQALSDGRRLYRRSPKRFVRRLSAAHPAAQK